MPRHPRRAAAALTAALLALASPIPAAAQSPAAEHPEIARAFNAYAAAWVTNDPDRVLATLTDDVVLMPSGMAPLQGKPAARAFWWPADGPTTTVTAYETQIDDIRATADLAVVRATSTMTFTTENSGVTTEQTNRSMSLTVLERGGDGKWRIAVRMWGRRG